jgi:hypothetical protein
MALAAPRTIAAAGTSAVLNAPSLTETIQPLDDIILHVENGATSSTVTLVDGGSTPAGNAGTGLAIVVGASAKMFIAVPAALVNPSTGLITVTFSNATTITGEWLTR